MNQKPLTLREKLNKIEDLSLEKNDLLYSILEEIIEKIEEKETKKVAI